MKTRYIVIALISNSVLIVCLSLFMYQSVMAQTQKSQQQTILPEQIWIFDNNETRVHYKRVAQQHPVSHYNLDQTAAFEQQMSMGLSGSVTVAKAQALKRIKKLTPSQLAQFRQAYSGIVQAFQMNVRKLPAIVFEYKEQRFVVYGQQQAAIALQEFQQWQRNH